MNEYQSLIKQHEEERKHILLDLETVREINSKIEGQREAHARQAANRLFVYCDTFRVMALVA
jgi:hypothetical protein